MSDTTASVTQGKHHTMESRPGPVCFSLKFSSCPARREGSVGRAVGGWQEEGRAYGELVAVYREGARSVALEEVAAYTSRVRVDPPRARYEPREAYLGT